MTSPKPLVIVSKSEPADAVPRLQSYGLNAQSGEAGTDYVWFPHGQRWGAERKTVSNLLGSLKDRQLVEQAQRGVRAFDRYLLLIEGRWDKRGTKLWYHSPRDPRADSDGWVESGWQWDAVDGMLFDLKLIGVQVEQCWEAYEYPAAIARIVLNTVAESHNFIRERQRPDLPAEAALGGELYSDALWALMALPGVGPEVAQALLAEYGSLATTIAALADARGALNHIDAEDVKVNGKKLGTKRVAKMYDAVTQRFTPATLE